MMEYFNVYRTGNKISIDDTSCATRADAADEHLLVSDIYTRNGGKYVWTLAVDGDRVTAVNLEWEFAQRIARRDDCPKCRGRGEIEDPLFDDSKMTYWRCSDCHGTGKIAQRVGSAAE